MHFWKYMLHQEEMQYNSRSLQGSLKLHGLHWNSEGYLCNALLLLCLYDFYWEEAVNTSHEYNGLYLPLPRWIHLRIQPAHLSLRNWILPPYFLAASSISAVFITSRACSSFRVAGLLFIWIRDWSKSIRVPKFLHRLLGSNHLLHTWLVPNH